MSTDHRTELLEAEIRRLRQIIRNVSNAVIAGDEHMVEIAQAAKDLIGEGGDGLGAAT